MSFRTETLAERIRQKIAVAPSGCWLWQGYRCDKGYGIVRWEGRPRKAHRVVYEILVGQIPAGLQIDHLCKVKNCVNPAHLEPVTLQENLARATPANTLKTHCPKGHEYSQVNTYVCSNGKRSCRQCAAERKTLRWLDPEFRQRRAEYLREWRRSQNA